MLKYPGGSGNMKAIILIILVIVNIFTVYKFLFNAIFRNSDDFAEAVRYSFTPNFISLLRGEYWKDKVGEFKLGMFILLCIAATAVEYGIIAIILSWIIKP
jgi:ABC-type cobalt transport system substrate-binding protein